MEKDFDVFLSHNSQDKPWVVDLKNALVAYGLKVWLDQDEIRPGDLFAYALEKGIAESKSVALIISPEAMSSGWVREEYYRALSLAVHGNLQLIPVLYKKAEIPGFLSNRSWVDFRNASEYDEKVRDLIWGIRGKKPDPKSKILVIGPLSTDKLKGYLESVQIIIGSLGKMLAIPGQLYEDQCKVIIEKIDILDSTLKIPASYEAAATIVKLDKEVSRLKNQLVIFSKTCPPGDSELRSGLITQMDILNKTVSELSKNSPYP